MHSILISGGTGYFGRALVRRLLRDNLSERICIFSRDEWKQSQMRAEFQDDPRLRWFIGDIRDRDRLTRAMHGIETVIHAAALKRIETGEYNPDELVKTNVLGALNVIAAATDAGVRNVVALSTDKAAAPCNGYGASKLLSEKLFLAANNSRGSDGPHFGVTRYGNVAGSTGSVIPIWRQRLAEGRRLTITDPKCTRFWMTADEAVDLVLWTVGKEYLVVPDLPAYRLIDLAWAMTGTEDELQLYGLRDGEKLDETMVTEQEMHRFVRCNPYWVNGAHGTELLPGPLASNLARRMSVEEIREALKHV